MTGKPHNHKRREFVLKLARLSAAISLCVGSAQTLANRNSASIKGTKVIASSKNQLKFQISLDKAAKYKVFTLKAPDRVVIDLLDTAQPSKLAQTGKGQLKRIRHATRNENDLRLVLDLAHPASVDARQNGAELEISMKFNAPAATPPAKKPPKKPAQPKATNPAPIAPTRPRRGDFIIAIDAGHGGKDPGAVGARGTYEKDVVLQIARKLKAQIDRAPGMKAVLTREGDYYIPLRKRMEIARKKHADLFVSVHADANPHKHLTGSSVYILSENGASSEAARWLASSENSYEQNLGGATLEGKDSTLTSMLMDLSQAATIDNSLNLAKRTLNELKSVNRLLHSKVESAAFVVLKSPDIPSMLVETAFISNPEEERRLKTASYQNKLANAMFRGIRGYKLALAPGGRLRSYASNNSTKQHIVKPGESLSVIAREYGIPQSKLKAENQLSSTLIQVGQKLSIPTRS